MDMKPFDAFVASNIAKSAETNSVEREVIVLSVTDWKPTKTGLAVKMVRTNIGTYWPLASAITNLPSSIGQNVTAKAVITRAKTDNPDGTPRFNMSRLEFNGLATDILLGIREMKPGTALFASAAGLRMN